LSDSKFPLPPQGDGQGAYTQVPLPHAWLSAAAWVRLGVPNRTSYELHLPAEMIAWYSAVELQRTLSGRSTDAWRMPA
jgi:hypothetical protein